MAKAVKLSVMEYDLKPYWFPDSTQQDRAHELATALLAVGHSACDAKALVEAFHNDAFTNGVNEEAFNNCCAQSD